ncbi:hypothetical protein [Marilutibacter chinensis]|uniref:Uncharacterized protein n=1 Tax=Marilutibacter chinensis TaxID=2912247 RepID=A0ABS9HXN2_9GAMM|nr:hypothetical protein [Lysobacter chinensis]MCF7222934.1 hypothetical protein [Lysobacter chinensis]
MEVALALAELALFFFVYAVFADRLMVGLARRSIERHAGRLPERLDDVSSFVSIAIIAGLPMAALLVVTFLIQVPDSLCVFWGAAWLVSIVPGGKNSRRLMRAAGIDPDER